MIEPGYSPSVYDRVRMEGHELALHYNALEKEDGVWSPEEFSRQLQWAITATGEERMTSNKNHYRGMRVGGSCFNGAKQMESLLIRPEDQRSGGMSAFCSNMPAVFPYGMV